MPVPSSPATPGCSSRRSHRVEGDPKAGEEVEVYSHEAKFVGRGIFNPNSAIRVRLYRWDGGALDEPFWAGLLVP